MYHIYIDNSLLDIIFIDKYFNSETKTTDIAICGDHTSRMTYILYSGNDKLFTTRLGNIDKLYIRAHMAERFKNTFIITDGKGTQRHTCTCIDKSDIYITIDRNESFIVTLTTKPQPGSKYIEIYGEDDIVE